MGDASPTTPSATTPKSPIRLRPFERADFDQMIAWAKSRGFLLQWTGKNFTWPLDTDQLTRYLDEAQGGPGGDQPQRIVNSVVDSASGALIGHIGLAQIDQLHRSARLSCVLIGDNAARGKAKGAERGQGLGQVAVRAMCRTGFDDLGLHRIDLGVWELNPGAIACYEKVGFKKEGLFRDFFRLEGEGAEETENENEYRNIFQMSLLEDEWRGADARE